MSSRSEAAWQFVQLTVTQLGTEFALPLAEWAHAEHGDHLLLDLIPPNHGTASLGIWVVGATALVFVDNAEPIPFDLGAGSDAVAFRELLAAVIRGSVQIQEYLAKSASFPFLLTWPGAQAQVNVPRPVWRRRTRLDRQTRTFQPWSAPPVLP